MIDTSVWKPFEIKRLFKVVKGKRLTKKDMLDGDTPFIGSSAFNNGVTNYIGNDNNVHEGNLITVAYNGSVGETFYHDYKFIASDDVNVLYPKFELNKFIALFLCPIIKKAGRAYEFVDKWKKEDMEKTLIYLPAISKDEPDWQYMETYMKKILEKANRNISKLTTFNRKKDYIDITKWKEFRISKYFTFSLPQGDLQVKLVEDGDVPLITPSNYNNGLLKRISKDSKSTKYSSNCMTVDMFGNAYYQDEDFFVTAHGHVNVLIPKFDLNKYIGFFVASAIRMMFKEKYSFSEMCTQKVLKKEKIKLPVTSTGEPDWQYMEDYMKMIMKATESKISILEKIS
ncbi:restriction endonuclease subunit S [Selenomonas montiformis]|uniref:restriction endonuclease subunit S n=1 Tax=Selenomonas montiformis TaxID=2652285 RepID=UPI003F8BCED3